LIPLISRREKLLEPIEWRDRSSNERSPDPPRSPVPLTAGKDYEASSDGMTLLANLRDDERPKVGSDFAPHKTPSAIRRGHFMQARH